MPVFEQIPPLALYIHFPWCVRKCPYCDFNSHEAGHGADAESAYIDALIRDLEFELSRVWGRRIISIFIGGGTPSLISAKGLERLLLVLQSYFNLHSGIEFTLEANPGTTDIARFSAYREAGVNRLSIGIQSFDNEKLTALGRIHNGDEARRAIDMAHEAGFTNVNVDLMYGLPGQGISEANHDLNTALEYGVTHISRYQLTLEPNTVFFKDPPVLPHEDDCWEMQEQGILLLQEQDYGQYEISAYALKGHRCAHNLNYWEFGDYLGIGAGAHGKISDPVSGNITRYSRHRLPERYMQLAGDAAAIVREQKLNNHDIVLEFMMNTLRLTEGFQPELFQDRTGMPLSQAEPALLLARERGLIECNPNTIRATPRGRRYLNDLLQLFMQEETACA